MSAKRRDKKGRVLRNNESQRSDGRYAYKYFVNGTPKFAYSWKLEKSDSLPAGKRECKSLREIEKEIERDLNDGIFPNADDVTVMQLVEKYLKTKTGVRANTKAGYKTIMNFLKNHPFAGRKIATVRMSDAKAFFIKLQKEEGRSYSFIHSLRGVLRQAFRLAYEDNLIRKNVFDFPLSDVIYNDSEKREALTRQEEVRFLEFVKQDGYYSRYYDAIFVLFNTGLRIGEFAGLTEADIDFENMLIRVNHQLQRNHEGGLQVIEVKTDAGKRILPMSIEVAACFRHLIKDRKPPRVEPTIDGMKGFFFYSRNGKPYVGENWAHIFSAITKKYNSIYKAEIGKVTPHVCRHTYCSNMAKAGINPKALQYLMGHSDIAITLNVYTHIKYEDAKEELCKLQLEG